MTKIGRNVKNSDFINICTTPVLAKTEPFQYILYTGSITFYYVYVGVLKSFAPAPLFRKC